MRNSQRAAENERRVLPEPRSENHFRQGKKKAISPEHHIRYGPSTFGKESRVVHVRIRMERTEEGLSEPEGGTNGGSETCLLMC